MKLPESLYKEIFKWKRIPIPYYHLDNAHCVCDNEHIILYEFLNERTLIVNYVIECESCGFSSHFHTNLDDLFYEWLRDVEHYMIGDIH